ncbi:ribonuclease H-like domain-containing protein [Cognatilysobacter lacus]|uniref:ribonuclease H-like domain-containing protein n=1 Tax=Cognatilysobacter lacus TaxID=1643323 RepID=UPI003CCCB739
MLAAGVAMIDAPAAAAPGGSPPPRASADGLRRLLGLRDHVAAPRPRARAIDRMLPGEQIDDGLWLIESAVAHPVPDAPLPLAFARRDGHVHAHDLLFFDTETTGLAGGTGTRAFMIGAADWFEGALRVRQLYIANMAAERAMLRTFASWLSPSTVLSSYNGRSYDAPLLRTRYRLARQPDPLHGLDHLDLLHPSRRRWRGRWENCRLATIEREALRILREDDLPGSQAPAAWLSYLRGGASTNLRRVAEHNRQDVATLSQLLLRLCDDSPESPEAS